MHNTTRYALTVLLLSLSLAQAETVLSVIERRPDQKEMPLLSKTAVVDINSLLLIRVNKYAIAGSDSSGISEDMRQQMVELGKVNRLLSLQNDLLGSLDRPIAAKPDTLQYHALSNVLNDFYGKISGDSLLGAEAEEQATRFLRLPKSLWKRGGVDRFILEYFVHRADTLSTRIDSSCEASGQRFSLVAYKLDGSAPSPVHIENFDSLAAQGYYEVSRWVLSLSEEDRQTLKTYEQLADSLNENIPRALRSVGSGIVNSLATPKAIAGVRRYCDKIGKTLADSCSLAAEDAAAQLRSLSSKVDGIGDLFAGLRDIADNRRIPDNVSDLLEIIPAAMGIVSDIESSWDQVLRSLNGCRSTGRDAADSLATQIRGLRDACSKDSGTIDQFVTNLQRFFAPTRDLANAAGKISEKVRRFTFTEIPDKGSIDLSTTGRRRDNDRIIIKAVLTQNVRGGTAPGKSMEVERWVLSMARIGVHLDATVSFNMLYPLRQYDRDGEVKTPQKFQYAASSYLLLKLGLRRLFWNEYLDAGLGTSVPLTDLNLDGKPDLCLGGVITLFRNVISLGGGYDFDIDVPYTFFGISIPVLNLFTFPPSRQIPSP